MFSGALPLVVAGNGTQKVSIVISKSNQLSFEIAMATFYEPAAPKILKTNQFYFLFVPDCAACNIQVVKIRQSKLRAAEIKG